MLHYCTMLSGDRNTLSNRLQLSKLCFGNKLFPRQRHILLYCSMLSGDRNRLTNGEQLSRLCFGNSPI